MNPRPCRLLRPWVSQIRGVEKRHLVCTSSHPKYRANLDVALAIARAGSTSDAVLWADGDDRINHDARPVGQFGYTNSGAS